MSKGTKMILTFSISFILAFFIVGYVKNTMFVEIDWIAGSTIWDKFREYYIRTFSSNIIPALIAAIIPTFIVYAADLKKGES